MPASPEYRCDVLVIGGGPGGSTVSAFLAQKGWNVVLLEKEHHPRFHIGESLLPLNLPLLERLGVKEEVERIGMPKYGAEFVSPHHDRTITYEFANSWRKDLPHAYQVRRSAFDHILLKNAAASGATVVEQCHIREVEFPPDGGVVALGRDDQRNDRLWRARYLVDASGRDTLM